MRSHDDPGARAGLRPRALEDGRVKLPVRTRVLDELFERTQARITVLRAPTGYGKTRTGAAWLGDDGETVRWIVCDEDRAPSLWRSMHQALARSSSQPDEPAEAGSGEESARAIRAAKRLTAPLTLVIDDYHLATSGPDDLALAELSLASPLLSLVVIGRRVTLLDGPLIAARTRVRVIEQHDLALTAEERRELAEAIGLPPSDRLEEALERTGGWPLAIRAALGLGSDELYSDTEQGRVWQPSDGAEAAFDPVAELDSLALDYLEILDANARLTILAISQIDTISLPQIGRLLDVDRDEALAVAHRLLELGLVSETPGANAVEYRCHPSVKTPLCVHALKTVAAEERKDLYRTRAAEIEHVAPFSAFRLYCSAEEYAAAEILLARNFTLLTDETEICARVLRTLPESALSEHPTLTAALLFLELPRVSIAPATVEYLVGLWRNGLRQQLPQGVATPPGPIHLPLLCQAMVVTRMIGQLDVSNSIMRHIEARLTPVYLDEAEEEPGQVSLRAAMSFRGSLPIYFREVASTALMVGDFARARRSLKQLQHRSEQLMAKPWHGFPPGSTRTVTDAESGSRWLLAALAELAFTELLDGDMRRCAEIVAQYDAHATRSGSNAPGISWFGIEIVRAHLAYEQGDDAMLARALERLMPLIDRVEAWQLVLIGAAAVRRNAQGPEAALAYLQAAVASLSRESQTHGTWSEHLLSFEAMLCTTIGDLSRAQGLIASAPSEGPKFVLERARHALFAGDDVEALLLVESVSDPGTTRRQQVDRRLIQAVAAWGCDRRVEAFEALAKAGELVERYGLPSMLQSVPYEQLHELAVAARDAGVCDVVALVESVPAPARPRRYERLTEMELRTLAAIAEHRSASQAAASLFVTPGTVKKHLASVYRKLGAKGRDEAIFIAGRIGLLA